MVAIVVQFKNKRIFHRPRNTVLLPFLEVERQGAVHFPKPDLQFFFSLQHVPFEAAQLSFQFAVVDEDDF